MRNAECGMRNRKCGIRNAESGCEDRMWKLGWGRRLIGIVSLSAIIAGVAGTVSAEVIDRVLAVVGGQLITLTDVMAARDLQLGHADPSSHPIPSLLSH